MSSERFPAVLALPLASLFLILLLCVFALQKPASMGIRMPLLRIKSLGHDATCDGRWVFVELLKDGTAQINLKPVSNQELSTEVGRLMQSRAERVVFLVPSPDIPYARFVETLSALQQSAPDTHVGVLSGVMRDQYIGPPIESPLERTYVPCDIVWPANEFRATEGSAVRKLPEE